MSKEKIFREGLLGRKLGMTHIFGADGKCIPVTLIRIGPCYVLSIKDKGKHGYSAVQLGFEPKKAQRSNKPAMGHFSQAGKGAFYHVGEIRCDVEALGWNTVGKELKASDVFQDGELVDVSGISIGRGFSGVVRRHGMKGQPATRGTHEYRRHVGAIGCRKFPGHVFKNKRMPGHLGASKVTIQNLELLGVKPEDNVILVKGAVPGYKGSIVVVRRAIRGFLGEDKKAA